MEDDRYTRITLRIPKDLHERLQAKADESSKSTNAEIVARLERSFAMLSPQNHDTLDVLGMLVTSMSLLLNEQVRDDPEATKKLLAITLDVMKGVKKNLYFSNDGKTMFEPSEVTPPPPPPSPRGKNKRPEPRD